MLVNFGYVSNENDYLVSGEIELFLDMVVWYFSEENLY